MVQVVVVLDRHTLLLEELQDINVSEKQRCSLNQATANQISWIPDESAQINVSCDDGD